MPANTKGRPSGQRCTMKGKDMKSGKTIKDKREKRRRRGEVKEVNGGEEERRKGVRERRQIACVRL